LFVRHSGDWAVKKRLLRAASLAMLFAVTGSGCRVFCDRYCDRRDRCDYDNPPPRRIMRDDPCRYEGPPPAAAHYQDDCR
jgi:hypothetical protein